MLKNLKTIYSIPIFILTMEIKVERAYKGKTYTIGHMYIDGEYFCDTLEDTDRLLSDEMTVSEIKTKKVYGKTAIPTGSYKTEITYSPKFKKKLPLLYNVKGFDGIRIHNGNDESHTLGCILVGENKVKGKVINSNVTLTKLLNKLKNQTNIKTIIKRNY